MDSKDIHQDSTQLWVGDVKSWMDEQYLAGIFGKYGQIKSVKIIRDKQTGLPVGYGFVEFASHEIASKVLESLTGTINPGSRKMFKLNWGVYGGGSTDDKSAIGSDDGIVEKKKSENNGKPISVYVGDLTPDVTKPILLQHFAKKYPSAFAANIIYDQTTRLPKGYGFVQFADRSEADAAIKDLDGTFLRGRAIKVRESYTRSVVAKPNPLTRPVPKGRYIPQKGMIPGHGHTHGHHAAAGGIPGQVGYQNQMAYNNYLGVQIPGSVGGVGAQAMQQAQMTNQQLLTAYALQQHQFLLQQQAAAAQNNQALLQPLLQSHYPVYNGVMVQPLISGVGLVGMPPVNNAQTSLPANIDYSKPKLDSDDKPLLGPRPRPEESKDDDLEQTDTTEKVKKNLNFFKKLKTGVIEKKSDEGSDGNRIENGNFEDVLIGPKLQNNGNFGDDLEDDEN